MKILFLVLFSVISIQTPKYVHNEDFDNFKTDNLNNFYIVSGESIALINDKGVKMFEYNNPKLGDITTIDQTSSLRTMVFYKDQSTFLVLDNTLTVQSPRVRLNQFGLNYISLMCASENNHYWCFDSENNSVVRINQQLSPVSIGVDLNQFLSQVVNPTEIIERHGKVYLNDPENGVHIFDTYGNYEKTLDLKKMKGLEVKNDILYYLNDKAIYKMNLQLMISETVLETDETISDFNIQVGRIFYKVGRKIFEKRTL